VRILCKHIDSLGARCLTLAAFDGYCGSHLRMLKREAIREQDPSLTYREIDRLLPQLNKSAIRRDISTEAKMLRYVFPYLKYKEAVQRVIQSRSEME
jgi:hypothetical protein